MKMKNGFILLSILLITLMSIPIVKALDDGEIQSVSCKSMTGGVVNNNHNATIDKLNVKVDDVHFEDVGDYLTCDIVVKNNSEDELSVDLESISNKSDEYITYSLTTEGENKVVKGSSKKYVLDIKYIKEYTTAKTIDNNVLIELSGNVKNPDTISSNYIIIITSVLIISLIILFVAHKKKTYLMLLSLGVGILIPTVYALTKITINLNNRIIIEQKYAVYYEYNTYIPTATFEEEKAKYYKIESNDYCETFNNEEYCSYTVTSKENTYKAGDTVIMVDYKVTNYNGNTYDLISFGDYYSWLYTTEDSTEIDNMQFSGAGSDYIGINCIIIYALPKNFIMPAHDVTFKEELVPPPEGG